MHFRGGSRDSEKGEGALCQRTWLADKENFRFQMVWEGQNNVRNYKILGEIFLSVFLNVLQFYIQWKLADEILSIFQNLQTLSSEKGKNTLTAANERKNWEKPFKMIIINHFFFNRFVHNIFAYFASSFTAWFSLFDIKRGNWEQQIPRNGKLRYLFQK